MEELRSSFVDPEYRYGYAESFLDTYVAAQIRALREQRGLEQSELAVLMGTKQSAISRLEDVNYSSWSVKTLKKLAHVFSVRLKISFEQFSTLPVDVENFNVPNLRRAPFEKDPVFSKVPVLILLPQEEEQQEVVQTDEEPPKAKAASAGAMLSSTFESPQLDKKPPAFDHTKKETEIWNSLRSSLQG